MHRTVFVKVFLLELSIQIACGTSCRNECCLSRVLCLIGIGDAPGRRTPASQTNTNHHHHHQSIVMTCSVWCSCCYIPIATVDAAVCAHAQYCTGGSRSAAAFCEDSSVDGVTDMAVSACNSLIATTALDSLNSQSKNWREKMGGKQLLKVKPPECTITK